MGQETKRVQSQNDTQIAINRENIKHQKEENALDREFQANQWQREFDQQSAFQRQFWKEQFEAENAFNSPTAQVARLQAAGINPAALVSNISGVASAAASPSSSAPSPSSPSGGHGVSGSIPSALPMSTDAALFSSLAQLNDSLNNAAKVGLQANEQNVMLDRMARNMAADTENKQASARSLNLDSSIKAVFGSSKASAEIQKTLSEAKELETKGDLNGSLMKYYNALEIGTSQENAYKKDAYPVMLDQLKTEIENIKSQIEKNKASATESLASAQDHVSHSKFMDALANTENKLRDGRFEAQYLSNELSTIEKYLQGNELRVSDATTNQRIDALMQQFYREGIITQNAWFDYQQAKKWDDKQRFINYVGSTVHAVNEATQSVSTPYGTIKNAEIRDRFNDIYESGQHGSRKDYRYNSKNKDWEPYHRSDY